MSSGRSRGTNKNYSRASGGFALCTHFRDSRRQKNCRSKLDPAELSGGRQQTLTAFQQLSKPHQQQGFASFPSVYAVEQATLKIDAPGSNHS